MWETELEHCALPNTEKEYLLDGLRHGFKLFDCAESVIPSYESGNYSSAVNACAKPKLDKLFQSELLDNKISKVEDKPKCIHAIGAVPKKDSDELRPITDCKRPLNGSLNNFIDYPTQSFNTIDDVTHLMSQGCYFAIVDIKKAYRAVPVFSCAQDLSRISLDVWGPGQVPIWLLCGQFPVLWPILCSWDFLPVI